MRLTNIVRGRRVRKSAWPSDEWLKILSVGRKWVCAVDPDGVKIVFAMNPFDEEWHLQYPSIPLRPLKKDFRDL